MVSKQELNENITAVIRAADERTKEVCKQLLEKQLASENIFTTNEPSFFIAHRKSIEIGIEQGRKWTLIIDADVLVREGIVNQIYEKGEKLPKTAFELHSKMLDKFFGGTRFGGIKLYRTSMLPLAITFIPDPGSAHRPETTMIKAMHKRKHWWILTDLVTSVHDFEQYYNDIFRKGFTHGIKFDDFTKRILPYWERMAEKDLDFKVLLEGFRVGNQNTNRELMLEKTEVWSEFEEAMKRMGLKEKDNIQIDSLNVDKLISEFESPKEYFEIKGDMDSNLPYQPNLFLEKLKSIFK